MRQVNVHQAKQQLSRLLDEVEGGACVVIARAGEPIAVLVPYKAAVHKVRLGLFAGQATIRPDFDELPADNTAAFGVTST